MKYKLLRFSLLSILAMLGGLLGSNAFAADKWVKTAPSDLATGDVVVIVDQTSATAMLNSKGNSAPTATSITLNTDKSEITSAVSTELQWVVTASTDDSGKTTYMFGVANSDNYLYCTAANNGVKVGTEDNKVFKWVADATNTNSTEPFLVNVATSRYVGVYYNNNAAQDWRCYTTIHNNIKATVTAFYKKTVDASDNRVKTTLTLGECQTSGYVGGSMAVPEVTVATETTALDNPAIRWESSNTDVATIEEGVIYLKAVGSATITATYAGDETNYLGSSADFTLTVSEAPYTSIADMVGVATSSKTMVTYQFENLLVTYVNGKYTYVSDDQNGFLFFGNNLGLKLGEVISGTAIGQLYTYNGLPEMSFEATGTSIDDEVISTDNNVIWETITPADLADNINKPVVIKNAVYVSASGQNLTFKVGDDEFIVRNNWNVSITDLVADKAYTLTGMGNVYVKSGTTTYQLYLVSFQEEVDEPAGFRDIKLNLMEHSELTTGSSVYITVSEDGSIGTTDDVTKAAATITASAHGSYGSSNFTASVPVEGCVKITYATHDYGNVITVTNEEGDAVASLNTQGAKWMENHDNVVVAYYRLNEPTTLNFSNANYNPYFAVEAIDEADLPEEVTEYTITFDKGKGDGVAPAAIEVEEGQSFIAPGNYSIFAENKTLTGWSPNETSVYEIGQEITPEGDMTLTAAFTGNDVELVDRTEAVTITFALDGTQGKHNISNSGLIVTQAVVDGNTIDVKADITAGSLVTNNNWHKVDNGFNVTIPSAKGATVVINTYEDPTNQLTFGESSSFEVSGADHNWTATYTATDDASTLNIAQSGLNYWKSLVITLPVVQSEEPGDDNVVYLWTPKKEKGGEAMASGGNDSESDITDNSIRLKGKKDFSSNVITITLDNALKSGDEIAITAYRDKNEANKKSGALLKFEKGSTNVSTATNGGLEFVNINSAVSGTDEYGTEPNTVTLTVPGDADDSKTITITRAETQTNLFITKLVITRPTSDEPGDEPEVVNYDNVIATWDFENDCAGLNSLSAALTSIDSDVDGISLTLAGGTTRDNDNSYQFANGLTMQIPVKTNKDIITVIGYPGYTAYTIGADEGTSTSPDVTHKVTSAEAELGYAILTAGNNCYIKSITVEQNSGYEEKMLFSTDFSDWSDFGASTSKTTVNKTTKYTNEALDFGIYNTAVLSVDDTKFSAYTELPHMALQAAKAADPYVTTSKLASITKVRFIHGATGGNRGWKLEAKGDRDDDWVVISDATADPAAWSEVTAEVNRQNVQLRWTNLTTNQNAYMFELDIYGMVDMSSAPILGTFKANDVEYVAGDIFEQNNNGDYEATIEISKKETMISEANPLTDIVADNGEVGTVTYQTTGEGDGQTTVVTIPVTMKEESANYIATFKFKADYTLTYYEQDGVTVIGTQTVEKDAAIGQFAYGEAEVTVGEGMKFRGWGANTQASANRKFTVDDVITANANLYAVVTEIETESSSARYDFNLTDQYFYAEDHEAFNPEDNGKWHDAQHGWVFSVGDKIDILVGGNANIILGCCAYSGGSAITLTNGSGDVVGTISNDKVATDGQKQLIEYKGEAGTLTITFGGTSYLHNLTIMNVTEPTFETDGDWFFVEAGDANSLLNAIDVANAANGAADASRKYIFLPNGTYDLGTACLTQVSGNNISIIGESQEGVTIKNSPTAEGIGVTATLLITGKETYLQDLTIQNAWDYYGGIDSGAGAGRAVCIQDKGTNTICKNVTLLSYQDTYYTNNANGNFYWETSDIHGTVDFICGEGTLFMENSTLTVEKRNSNGSGGCTLTAPSTKAGNSYGYVFSNCTIQNYAENYNFGRAWNNEPRCAYINTTVNDNKLVASRWTAQGMNNGVYGKKFVEYNTKDADGKVVSPSSKSIRFYDKANAVSETYETILTDDEAAEYAVGKVFTDWTPATYAAQLDAPAATYDNGLVSWIPANNGAIAYLIEKNGEFVGITTESTFEVEAGADDVLTIRAANGRGGFGQAKTVEANTVTVTLNSAGYATLASDKALDFSSVEGLTAYIVTAAKDSKATLTSVDAAPAETGLVLKGAENGEYEIPVAASAAAVSGNLLEAAVEATPVEPQSYYVLNGNKFMLFAGTEIPAGKAYLPKSKIGAARLLELVFDDATGIATVDVDVPVNVYDLQGRRVKPTKKGIYVVDGKKVIIK